MEVVRRDTGQEFSIGAYTGLIARSQWTRGTHCILDQIVPSGLFTPVHTHTDEDQAVFVIEGSLTCWVDGEREALATGDYAFRPAGLPHSLWNASDAPVRMLEITSPGERFEEYIGKVSALVDSGAADADTIAALAADYGISFDPALTARLTEELQLGAGGSFWK